MLIVIVSEVHTCIFIFLFSGVDFTQYLPLNDFNHSTSVKYRIAYAENDKALFSDQILYPRNSRVVFRENMFKPGKVSQVQQAVGTV